jgi:hypothetical protein
MKAYWGNGDIDPHILDLGTGWRRVVRLTPRPLYPQGKSSWYPLDRRLGDLITLIIFVLKNIMLMTRMIDVLAEFL